MRCTRISALCLFSVFAAGRVSAQTPIPYELPAGEPDVPEKAGKALYAFRVTGESPRIDGRLDDEVWSKAQSFDDFTQNDPDNGASATERTVIRVAYDDRYLYFAAWCYSKNPATVAPGLGRRGSMPSSTDTISFNVDTRHDHRSSYIYRTNPSGVMDDLTIIDDWRLDSDYEAVWEVRTSITGEGWFAEFRVPFSQMRFTMPPDGRMVWGFTSNRQIRRKAETDYWVPNPRGSVGTVSRYGHLIFDGAIAPPRRLEIMPFVLGQVEGGSGKPRESTANAGIDLRVGVGNDATLAATVNPDFGQVEADPAVLNLSVFETFFPEKRPFFLEDGRVFNLSTFGQMPDFYSRRIGQRPGRIALKTGDTLVSQPDQTTILGAAKLTGRKSLWTYGGLAAITSSEHAIVDATSTDAEGNQTVTRLERLIEPRTLYSVGRLQRDIAGGSSTIGLIGTTVLRDGDANAFTGGGDANIRWGGNKYNWNTHWIGTRAPISGVMRSDIGGVSNVGYSGKYFSYNGHYDHFGRNFRNTDMGFLGSRTSKNEVGAGINLGRPDPWRKVRNAWSYLSVGRQWNDDGLMFGGWVQGGGNISFPNYWSGYVNISRSLEHFDDLDTRGGPPILRLAGSYFNGGINSDSRKTWTMSFGGGRNGSEAGDRESFANASLRVQPFTRLQASVSTGYTSGHDVAQWIKNIDADGDGVDDHVYGRLRRNVLNVTTRATYAFTRDMTVEAYLQPFAAAGDYSEIRKLARPSSFDFTPVMLADDPDFNRKSLRGTIVLRWEYIRGSAFYAVWNVANQDTSRPGVFSPWRDLAGGFGAPGASVFAVKVSYWFAP
jgi:hypothetical protein